jgi:hypothetical protein
MRKLKIESLDNEWIDSDDLMLHSCFQILKDFVEKENGDTLINYESHKDFVDEVRFLYNWWVERIKKITTDKQMEEDDLMLIRLIKIRTMLWV